MKTIRTSIELPFTAQKIWTVLTDFSSYFTWNPFIIKSAGRAVKNTRLHHTMVLPGKKAMKFKPIILQAEEPQNLSWLGRTFIAGVFDGHHKFILESTKNGNNKTKLIHEETFSGILPVLMGKKFWQNVELAFISMNQALEHELKQRF